MNNAEFIKKYWFFLEPYVYFIKKSNNVLIYNELNGIYKEFIGILDPILLKVIERFNSIEDENRIIEIDSAELQSKELLSFIASIRYSFSGDILEMGADFKPLVPVQSIHITDDVEFMKIDNEYLLNYEIKLSVMEITINTSVNEKGCSVNKHIFKEVCDIKKQCDIYKYIHLLSKQIPEFNKLRNLHLICYRTSLFDQLRGLITSINTIPVCIHTEIDVAFQAISAFGDSYTYYIYLHPSEEEFQKLENLIRNIQCRIIPFVSVECNDDVKKLENLLKYSLEPNIQPVYTGQNIEFFEENVYLLKEDILSQKLSVYEILVNQILNKNIFGRVYIGEDGSISSLGVEETKFCLSKNHILDFVYEQLKYKNNWFLVRNKLPRCGECIYQDLCPPVSFNEFLLNKFDMCNLL
jgi:pseudo-rSAM protein